MLLEAAATSATDEVVHFGLDGRGDLLSSDSKPGRFAEPYGSSKAAATARCTATVPGDVPI